MLAQINPAALPALRIAATFFLTVNIVAFVYIFRNRHRFFDKDRTSPVTFRPCADSALRSPRIMARNIIRKRLRKLGEFYA
jgi:hypothetical protein